MRRARAVIIVIAVLLAATLGLTATRADAICIMDPVDGGCLSFCPPKFTCPM